MSNLEPEFDAKVTELARERNRRKIHAIFWCVHLAISTLAILISLAAMAVSAYVFWFK